MKFGKIFRATVEQRMPQWRDHVVNYKAIKQAIKKQMAQGTHGSQPEEVAAAFTALIDQHVETVNNFYMERIEEGVIILHALNQHCEQIRGGGMRPELRTQCQRSLVAIHFQLLLLQNYVALNFTAVTKILKKFEKRFEIPIRNDYIGALVELPFYRCDALGDLVEETERQFKQLESLRPGVGIQQPQQPHQPQQLQQSLCQPSTRHTAHEQPVASHHLMPPPPPPVREGAPMAMQTGIPGVGSAPPTAKCTCTATAASFAMS